MAKVELDELVLGVSPLTEKVYVGVLDKRSKPGKEMWLHKREFDGQVLKAIVEKIGVGFVLTVKVSDGSQVEIAVREKKSKGKASSHGG